MPAVGAIKDLQDGKGIQLAYNCKAGEENCDRFRMALEAGKKASVDPAITEEDRSRLAATANAYGKDGEPGVDIVDDQNLAGGGNTARSKEDGLETVKIKFGNQSPESLGRIVMHEGQHVVDDQARNREVNSLKERRETEVNAYTTEAIYLKSIQVIAPVRFRIWTPLGGIDQQAIDEAAQKSIDISCGASSSDDPSCH